MPPEEALFPWIHRHGNGLALPPRQERRGPEGGPQIPPNTTDSKRDVTGRERDASGQEILFKTDYGVAGLSDVSPSPLMTRNSCV